MAVEMAISPEENKQPSANSTNSVQHAPPRRSNTHQIFFVVALAPRLPFLFPATLFQSLNKCFFSRLRFTFSVAFRVSFRIDQISNHSHFN